MFELDNPLLRHLPQLNVLAVEVHQRGLGADIVFGCDLRIEYKPVLFPTPPFQSVTQCQSAAISSGLYTWSELPPTTFQWYRNGAAIDSALNPSATNTTLVVTNMQAQDQGSYRVVVQYGRRTITSENAGLSLVVPTNGWRGVVRITKEPARLSISWDGCGTLEHSTDLLQWSDVLDLPASPYNVPAISEGSLFYRVRR